MCPIDYFTDTDVPELRCLMGVQLAFMGVQLGIEAVDPGLGVEAGGPGALQQRSGPSWRGSRAARVHEIAAPAREPGRAGDTSATLTP